MIARGLSQTASLAYVQKNYDKANRIYENALQLLPIGSVRRSIVQVGSARVLLALNSGLLRAESLARKALQIREKHYPHGHSMIAEAQAIVGLILHKNNQQQAAIQLLTAAYEVLAGHPLYSHPHSANKLTQRIHNILTEHHSSINL